MCDCDEGDSDGGGGEGGRAMAQMVKREREQQWGGVVIFGWGYEIMNLGLGKNEFLGVCDT